MRWKGWERVPLEIPDPGVPGSTVTVDAIAPVIVSASRETDIPAFYGDWFMARLRAGCVKWKSPWGGRPLYVSFAKTRVFAFWTKDPAPFLQHLDALDRAGFGYYFLFTLNDYEAEGLEPGVPPLNERIDTFIRLSERIGKGRVVWRFDPLVLSDRITVGELLDRISRIGDRIAPYCRRMVFSFVEIARYAKVSRNLQRQGFAGVREFSDKEVREFCTGLAALNRRWGLAVSACSDPRDLTEYGIGRGQCISYGLMTEEFAGDRALTDFLRPPGQATLPGTGLPPEDPAARLRDRGQRSGCRCIVSKDIGQYTTCMHRCAYCYANSSPAAAAANYRQYREDADAGIFHDSITG